MIAPQNPMDPRAWELRQGLPAPEAVTIEAVLANAHRRFPTTPMAERVKLAGRAMVLHDERRQTREAAAAMSTAVDIREREDWVRGIQILPVPGQPDRRRLVFDEVVEQEWAYKLAATLCQVIAYRCGKEGGAP